ncbi:uncharacterized protein LOC123295218 isoform X3 [Chrysoperla carnea]|uniref:uncharacterized protein LOC123295218 isoform X3 n=1 Tax=Chrysoperla carnea TaxID=189513 RepID=UPI001D096182|nr:uncharacterized protein LOC123295218 isoform X3 [Chrysoperla carnea]
MASATRTNRSRMKFPASMLDLHRYQSTAHGHDFDGLSRVVMVRKTDQRTFASTKNGEEPKFETITRETIETFHGNRTERKVTSLEKREGIRKSPDLGFHSSSELIHQNGTGAHSKTTTPKKVSSLKKKQPGAKSPEEFANECLEAHNEYRTKHGVPPLTLSKKLCKISQKWADKIAAKGSLEQSNNTDYGENIYCSWSSAADYQPTGREPVDSWYEESKRHQYGTEPNDLRSGHFTQVIWKETTELGVAYSRGKNGRIYVVANYSPPGNFIGDFAENVPPPIDTSKPYTMSGLPTTPSSKSTPTPRPPSSSSTGAEGDFEVDCLNAHNEYRRMHGVEPLKLNRKMCKYSEEWAKALSIKGQMEHRKNSEYGENIYCSWSSNSNHRINGREAVDQWYSEVKIHVFGREPNNLKSGHFTQVVWRDSRELGVAVAKNRNGQIFVVANYSPPGNFVGSFAENVLPLGGGSKHETKAQAMKTYSLSDFSIEGVRHHNELRKKHNVPELKHNEDLTKYAKEWAEKLAAEDRFYHRPDSKYGENIFYLWSSDPNAKVSPKDVCKSWYDEIKDYSFASEPRAMKAGHFTQMIWKGSTEMGMAMARGRNGKIYVVANYNPRGNIVGQFSANVPRPR